MKIQLESRKPYVSMVVDTENMTYMDCYYFSVVYLGIKLKWYQKLRFWSFCKFQDMKASVIKGLWKIFGR